MKKATSKERVLSSLYYFGPLGVIAFLKNSSDFEKFHAIQGLGLFYLFILLMLWAFFSLFVVPILVVVSLIGFCGILFWIGEGLYYSISGKKVRLKGIEFLTSALKESLIQKI